MRHILAGALLAALISPLTVSAQSIAELQAQIASLIAQITALQQGGVAVPPIGQSIAPISSPTSGAVSCPHISRTLKRGISGDDVARLQQFLALDPTVYPDPQVTGFYGALTEAAVKRFQCKHKLVCEGTPESTGYGVVGPRTAALMALQCPTIVGSVTPQVGGFVKVTPISGAAPLNAVIEVTVNTTRSCVGANYEVDFGDGAPPVQMPVAPNICSELRQVFNHTYQYGGTYVVTLRSGVHRTTATIVVSGAPKPANPGAQDTFDVAATSGNAPFNATFSGIVNAQGACNAGPYTIVFGDGATASLPITGCTASSFTVTHQYTSAGVYTAKLTRGSTDVGIKSISVIGPTGNTSGYGGYFSVSPVLDNESVDVTAQFDIESTCAAFDLDWGDGSTHEIQNQGSCALGVVSKQYSHDYANPGTYTITLRREQGFSDVDTASITISE